MRAQETIEALALGALAATLSDERRAQRLLSLTGLTPEELRARAGDTDLLASCLAFLESHEPDLVAVAGDLGVSPGDLVAARRVLDGDMQ